MADFLFIFLLSLYRQSGDLAGTCCLIETKLLSWSVQLDFIAQDIIVTELKIAFFYASGRQKKLESNRSPERQIQKENLLRLRKVH